MLMRVDLLGWSVLLIALAMGYLVCVKANKQENNVLKLAGYIIGIIVVLVSVILALSNLKDTMTRRPAATTRPRTGAVTRPPAIPRENLPKVPTIPTIPQTGTELPKLP